MSHLKKPSRREFLANMSYSLGLVSAGHIFNNKIFAQNTSPINRIVHVYFSHGILSEKGDILRGNWLINDTSPLSSLKSIAGDCRFIRNVDQRYRRISESHSCNQSSFLTGCSTNAVHGKGADLGSKTGPYGGRSIDLVAGDFLKKKYNTEVSSLIVGVSNQHADGLSDSSPYIWETVSWNKNKSPLLPIIQPSKVYADLYKYKQKNFTCSTEPINNDVIKSKINTIDSNIIKLDLIKGNLRNYYSQNLMPKVEMDKLEKQIADNIISKNKERSDLVKILDGQSIQNNSASCGELKNPGTAFDQVPPESTYAGGNKTNDKGFMAKTNTNIDLIAYALKSNYARSATLYLGGSLYKHAHGAGHFHKDVGTKEKCYAVHNAYMVTIGTAISNLIKKLKSEGLYNSTMIVICGEFGNQKNGTHKSTHTPWLVINSGKSGEHTNGAVHVGDIHTGTLNRIGNITAKSFGSSDSRLNRAGRLNTDIF